jgi:outer membrane protein assembly factor BamB
MYMNSPVLVGSHLFGLAQESRGMLFCLDVDSGKTVWASEGRVADNAAIVEGGGVLFATTTNGEIIVFAAAAERFQPLARYKVADSPVWAHSAIIADRILIKDQKSLALWRLKSD